MRLLLWLFTCFLVINLVSGINCTGGGVFLEKDYPVNISWDSAEMVQVSYDGVVFNTTNTTLSLPFYSGNLSVDIVEGNVSNCSVWLFGWNNTAPIPSVLTYQLVGGLLTLNYSNFSDIDGDNLSYTLNGNYIFNNTFGIDYGSYSYIVCGYDWKTFSCTNQVNVSYTPRVPVIISFSGPTSAFPLENRTRILTYDLDVNYSTAVEGYLNGKRCSLDNRFGDLNELSCQYDFNWSVYGPVNFQLYIVGGERNITESRDILKVGRLISVFRRNPVVDFSNIYNDWTTVSKPLAVFNSGNTKFKYESFMVNNISCSNVRFNIGDIYIGDSSNRATAVTGDSLFEDILSLKETLNFYMFLYNPGKVVANSCNSKLEINLEADV